MSASQSTAPAQPVTAGLLATMPLPEPAAEGSKEHRGRVLVVGGGVAVPGGVLLAATAALRAGAGKLQIATARSVALHLALAVPEALVAGLDETKDGEIAPSAAADLVARAKKNDAVVIGPGMLDEEAAGDLTRTILGEAVGPAYLIDAGAMARLTGCLDILSRHESRIVITPHAGEMAHLLGIGADEIADDPLR
jgi:NAD(P)H-hydrate repair Nnr-like enzyme with NAD(P)H-hydrate dehydratase domain